MNEVIKYSIENSESLEVLLEEGTVWLTQAQMIELFQSSKGNISEHIKHIFEEKELEENSVVRKFRTTAADGKQYNVQYYNLDVIISVGYRVKSLRGTQFRIWATNVLKEHLLKGYTVKQPATLEQLKEMKLHLESQIAELREQMENLDIITDTQYSEIYQALIELTSKKQLQESKPRKPIGFQYPQGDV